METTNSMPTGNTTLRPWQGTALGILNIIFLTITGIFLILFIITVFGWGTIFSVSSPEIS